MEAEELFNAPLPNLKTYFCLCSSDEDDSHMFGQLFKALHSTDYVSLPLVTRKPDGTKVYLQSKEVDLQITSHLIARLTPLPDFYHQDHSKRKPALQDLEAQVRWALHMNWLWLLFPRFTHERVLEYALFVKWVAAENPGVQLLIPVHGTIQSWRDYQTIRTISECASMRPLLILSKIDDDPNIVGRWRAEGCKHFSLQSKDFERIDGRADLHPRIRKLLSQLIANSCLIFIEGVKPSTEAMNPFRISLLRLTHECLKPNSPAQDIKDQYAGTLQLPLQPLRDNLPEHVYDLFLKDPIKYAKYTEAVTIRLIELTQQGFDGTLIIFVVGAGGRGPLVDCCIGALKQQWALPYHIYAIEKNPNAVITLKVKKETVWGDSVTIIERDMRDVEMQVKADIVVSELLGSFGCNELFPECLDGVQPFIKPNGISIPYSYSSWLAPISTSATYNQLTDAKMRETTWLCWIEDQWLLANPQRIWEFVHPNPTLGVEGGNDREAHVKWTMEHEAVIHGLAGYFHCVLYGKAHLSIEPATHSPEMMSWFPMFFPLREPVHVRPGEDVCAHMWRRSSASDVWYEWTLTSPRAMALHNPAGRTSKVSKF